VSKGWVISRHGTSSSSAAAAWRPAQTKYLHATSAAAFGEGGIEVPQDVGPPGLKGSDAYDSQDLEKQVGRRWWWSTGLAGALIIQDEALAAALALRFDCNAIRVGHTPLRNNIDDLES
jgi:hypothetical protein